MRCKLLNSFAFNLGRSRLLAPQSSADASVFVTERRQQKAQVQSVGHDSPEVCGCRKVWEAEGGLEIFRGIAPHPNFLALPFFLGATSSFQTQDRCSLHAFGLQVMRLPVHPA